MVPLQVISNYSLLKSTTRITDLVRDAKQKGYQAIALTDENVLFGQIEFYRECQKQGIKPIIGMQLYLPGIHLREETFPLVLLAKNFKGYQKLLSLSTQFSRNDPSTLLEELQTGMENILAITPGIRGEIEQLLRSKKAKEAVQVACYWKERFVDQHFYIGIQLYQPLQELAEPLQMLAKETSIPLTAMVDVRYLEPEQHFSCRVLQAIGTGEQVEPEQEERRGEYYLPSLHQLRSAFEEAGFLEEAAETERIASRLNVEMPLGRTKFPKFPLPSTVQAIDALREKCLKGLTERVSNPSSEYQERLEHELSVIHSMGFEDYFLIIGDVMAFAKKKKMFPGAGRGSAAGSLVAYLLYITHVDPITYQLLFERFLNKERYNLPDIDLDFPDDERDEVLRYVEHKYGHDRVAQIMTLGTLASKMSLRDTARVFGLTPKEAGVWAKAVPNQLGIKLKDAYRQSRALQALVAENEKNALLFETAVAIEGVPRHVSTHAAGIVISNEPLVETIPLLERPGELSLTQFQMGDVEAAGLVKMDFLGLKNLTILQHTQKLMQRYENPSIDLFQIPMDDEKTLSLFRRGDTNGIFQFESPGIKQVLRKIGPTSFEDVVAVNALYRPGPMEQIDAFSKRKKGEEPIVYPHDDLRDILQVTYGVMVYQEQVMQVASKMAGFTLGEADLLRRAIGKKQKESLDEQRTHFVSGSIAQGYQKPVAEMVYDYIERFANYGFNRSHSVAYAYIAYQMAYTKAHYPRAFFAALLNSVNQNSDKLKEYLLEIKKHAIRLTYPSINRSGWYFSIERDAIQFGFHAVKGLRRDFIQAILAERKEHGPYQSFVEFLRRLPEKWSKEEYLVPLIDAGMFDEFGYNRHTLHQSLPGMLASVAYSGNNIDLFTVLEPKYITVPEFETLTLIEKEEATLGYSLVGHPLDEYKDLYETSVSYIADLPLQKPAETMGLVKEVKRIQTKKGDLMAFVTITDATGSLSITFFPDAYVANMRLLKEGALLVFSGRMDTNPRNAERSFLAQRAVTISDYVASHKKKQVRCFIRLTEMEGNEALQILRSIQNQKHGTVAVVMFDEKNKRKVLLDDSYRLDSSTETFEKLRKFFGSDNVVVQ